MFNNKVGNIQLNSPSCLMNFEFENMISTVELIKKC